MLLKSYSIVSGLVVAFLVISCGGGNGSGSGDNSLKLSINYNFDESSGATAINSVSDAWHGTIFGADRVPGSSGNALRFGDPEDYLEIEIVPNPGMSPPVSLENNTIAIDADVYFDNLDINETYHFFGSHSTGMGCFRILVRDGNFLLQIYNYGTGTSFWLDVVESNFPFQINTWYEISIFYNGDEAVISIDGIENARVSYIASLKDIYNNLYIGGIGQSSPQSFPGTIDQFYFN